MVNITFLEKVLFKKEGKCFHPSIKKLTIAEAVDREGKFFRTYFCTKCNNYGWKDMSDENWDEKVLSKLKEDKYKVYSTLKELPLLRQFWER
jgi:hypothetical protein